MSEVIMNEYKRGPVFGQDDAWWFWEETFSVSMKAFGHLHGPFETQSHAQKTLDFLNR